MFILLTVAIAPGIALLSYLYLRKQIAKEPSRTLFHTFLYGAILTFPILFLQHVFMLEETFSSPFVQNVLFASTLEEFFKWLILVIAIYKHFEFGDPYDGVLYGASVSLGFATVENILYLLTFGLDTAFLRALIPVSSHALFGVVMGFYLGKAKFSNKEKSQHYLLIALIAPLCLHIMYNTILVVKDLWIYIMIPFMLFLWWFSLTRVKQAHIVSLRIHRNSELNN